MTPLEPELLREFMEWRQQKQKTEQEQQEKEKQKMISSTELQSPQVLLNSNFCPVIFLNTLAH